MSATTVQPSPQILARLRDPDATSDQFSSDELRKIYLDNVCFGGGLLPYAVLGAAGVGTGMLHELAHLSPARTFMAFCVVLFVIAGVAHAVMGFWFSVMRHETAFAKVQSWAIEHAPRDAGARIIGAFSRLVTPLLIIGVLLAAALTLPDKARHEAELRQAVTTAISSTDAKSADQAISKAAVWALNTAFKNDPTASYIDFLDLQYQKFGVFSVLKNKKGELVSIGAFNQVYFRDLSWACR